MSIWRSFAELWPKGASEGLRQTPPSLQAPASYTTLLHFSKANADQFDLSIMKFSGQFLRVLIQAPRSLFAAAVTSQETNVQGSRRARLVTEHRAFLTTSTPFLTSSAKLSHCQPPRASFKFHEPGRCEGRKVPGAPTPRFRHPLSPPTPSATTVL